MKLFRTGSSKVVNECQVSFGFLPAKSEILIRTASFLQKFTVSENSLCMLFANDARRQLHNIFIQFDDNIQTARQLRNTVFAEFFDKSQLLLINFVCFFMCYRVIYFQCLCYLALPLCIVSICI